MRAPTGCGWRERCFVEARIGSDDGSTTARGLRKGHKSRAEARRLRLTAVEFGSGDGYGEARKVNAGETIWIVSGVDLLADSLSRVIFDWARAFLSSISLEYSNCRGSDHLERKE